MEDFPDQAAEFVSDEQQDDEDPVLHGHEPFRGVRLILYFIVGDRWTIRGGELEPGRYTAGLAAH